MPETLSSLTVVALSAMLAEGKVSARELVGHCLSRIEKLDTHIHAFNSHNADDALAQADASDLRRARGEARGLLDGIPLAIKDNIAVRGAPLTASSRMLEKFVSPYDAHVTECLHQAGAVMLGRCNMDEFAMGSSTENSAFGPTRNPWDRERVPGGSSGGSAAAVAAGMTPLALGSDTGGSIRQPAAFCGVVGLKPTYGLVSRYGLAAFASSLDQIGPFARTVEDAALLLQPLAGHDGRDSTSCRVDIPDYRGLLLAGRPPCRIGLPKEYFAEGLGAEVRQKLEEAVRFYQAAGFEVREVSLPHTDLAVPVYYIIATAEASSNLARYDGVRYTHRSTQARDHVDLYFQSRAEGFGSEVKRRIILGTYVLSSGYYDAYYLRAQKARALIRRDFETVFRDVDVLLTPTTPTPAFRHGEKAADPLSMYLSDIYTINVNLAGLPGLSLPCGFTDAGLPVGMQLVGKPFGEGDLLAVAHAYDREHRYGCRLPDL